MSQTATAETPGKLISRLSRPLNSFNDKVFHSIYSRSLVYNTCWEDPAVDRKALNFMPDDTVAVITSAGCNALDYTLEGPKCVNAIDMNPRQNALLELKMAAIRELQHDDFFQIFGYGSHPEFEQIYRDALRHHLTDFAQEYWDKNQDWFIASKKNRGLYFYGLAGYVARSFHFYMKMNPGLRKAIDEIFETQSMEEQREIYRSRIEPHMWSKKMNWLISRQFTMNMLGVPHPQTKEVQAQHENGVAGFIRESIEYVFLQIPLNINYFWRVYLKGSYSKECCPEYLKKENLEKLKNGLVDNLKLHTCSVTDFLKTTEDRISKYILLDHMDWMSSYRPEALVEEWQHIYEKAADNTRIIFRSAHAQPAYLDAVKIMTDKGKESIMQMLQFHPELAAELHFDDRVHTYAGFHIADLNR